MSSLRFATPDALLCWLQKLAADHVLFAPHQEGSSVVFYRHTAQTIHDLSVLLRRATASPKEALLPRSEILLRFSAKKDAENPALLHTVLDAPIEAAPLILFRGRPCDARGFITLDRPYTQGKFPDPYYAARRAATLIITQACPSPYPSCFCTWVGSHPADSAGSDILFTAVDGGFALEACSDRGKVLLETSGFSEDNGKKSAAEAAHKAALVKLPTSPLPADTPARIAARFNDTAFWNTETAKCLSCGACTYLCPTCQCFTITDEGSPLDGKRLRSWDSCMIPQFTLETSGHNPRADKAKRMRNRVSHKFSFYPQNHDGNYSCCGCGRCVASCPVSLDIRHMAQAASALPAPDNLPDKNPPDKKQKDVQPAQPAAKPAQKSAKPAKSAVGKE